MVADGVNAEPDNLGVAPVEFRLEARHIAEFGGAYRREILGVRKQYAPRIADPFVKADRTGGRLRFEIWCSVCNRQTHCARPPELTSADRFESEIVDS